MSPNPMRCTLFGSAVVALALFTSSSIVSAEDTNAGKDAAPVVVAQASAPAAMPAPDEAFDRYPAYQRGVRRAAAEGPEALRRYIWRTRMIYNFYYYDFAAQQ